MFWKKTFARLKGIVGEWRVRWLLSRLGEAYEVYHNVYVPQGNGSLTQVDHVIVSRYQIFVIETKNYAGAVYGEEEERYWLQRTSQRERLFYNPVRQNAGHVRALQRIVGNSESVQSVIVFANATRLKLSPYMKEAKVLHNDGLIAFIHKFKRKVVPLAEVEHWNEVLKELQSKKRRARLKVRQQHLKDVRAVVGARVSRNHTYGKAVNPKTSRKLIADCPKCGEKLVLRNGKYGEFYGCSSFPECRYTVDK